jgi:hypothetical protein
MLVNKFRGGKRRRVGNARGGRESGIASNSGDGRKENK